MKMRNLAQLREEMNISQRNLAEAIGTAPSSIAMYETGLRTPPLEKAKRIAKFFGVLVDEIEFGRGARKTRAKGNSQEAGQGATI